MEEQGLYELVILAITVLLGVISILINKYKLSKKNNKMLKIIDTLMALAEFTGLKGEDKKQFVMDAFKDFKLGKIDNVEEYINDKVDLVNQIGIKPSLVNEVISEELEEQARQIELEHKQKMFEGHSTPKANYDPKGVEEDKMVQLERELDNLKNYTKNIEDVNNNLRVEGQEFKRLYEERGKEVLSLTNEVDRLKGVEIELAKLYNEAKEDKETLKADNYELARELEETKNLLKLRESQLRG